MDPLRPSRLRADYEKLEGNSFWVEFLERVQKKTDEAEKAPVHGPVDSPEAIGLRTMFNKGQFEALRSVLGLPDVILDNPTAPNAKR